MRIYVYAIAKNEEAFAARWMASMSEADGVYVLEGGSTDRTAEVLREQGAVVVSEITEPWRFDVARNRSMALVPGDADLLVCTDLDEVFCPGWRGLLEAAWRPDCTTARYEYVWSFTEDGGDGVKFLYEKIHRPGICRWTHPVHEVLTYDVPKRFCDVPGLRLEHHPDSRKSRAAYLPLLEMSVAEAPEDDRNRHYLGREYMFYGRWREAIDTLMVHLSMPKAVWRPERAASMRYIARCLRALNEDEAAEQWLLRAAEEAPEQREALVDLAYFMYERERWEDCRRYAEAALAITRRELTYTTAAEAWGALPWDLLSIARSRLGDTAGALAAAREAEKLAPWDERIRKNRQYFEKALREGAHSHSNWMDYDMVDKSPHSAYNTEREPPISG